jgi:hypothetical protein
VNGFDGLLPARVAPPVLPDRGGVAAIRQGAYVRRRRSASRAIVVSAAAVVAAAMVVLAMPHGDIYGLEMKPTGGTRQTAGPYVPPDPAHAVTGTGVAAGPRERVRTGHDGDVTATPAPSPTPRPSTDSVSAAHPRYLKVVRRRLVPDSGAPCRTQVNERPTHTICARYAGTSQARRGAPVDLDYEFCAQLVDIQVHFDDAREISLGLSSVDTSETIWTGIPKPGDGPHGVTVPKGECLRYTVRWDGRDDHGRVPASGAYIAGGTLWDTGGHTTYIGDEQRTIQIYDAS